MLNVFDDALLTFPVTISRSTAEHVSAEDLEEVVACESCGSTDIVHQLTAGAWTLMRCGGCDLVFTSPRLREQALKRHYERGYYEGTGRYFSSQSKPVTADQRTLVREVSALLRSTQPASLDVGCGGGQLVEAFSDAGFTALGTEPSAAACTAATRLGRNVKNVGLDTLPAESFDCVTAMHVLEHVSRPRAFLAEIARVTKQNGIVVIEVPNFGCKSSRRLGARWKPLYPDTHLFHYTPATLQRALGLHGFVTLRVRRLGGLGLLERTAGESPSGEPPAPQAVSAATRKSWGALLWGLRGPILRIPGARGMLRWLVWEVRGRGEYVRVIARKAAG